jgi:hypothetical protein
MAEKISTLITAFIFINSFLFVSLFMNKYSRQMALYIFLYELLIFSSVYLWHKYEVVYFILICITFAFFTHPYIKAKIVRLWWHYYLWFDEVTRIKRLKNK